MNCFAYRAIDNYKLDKQHTFTLNMFSDFDKYLDIPDEWEVPKEEQYKDQVRHILCKDELMETYS